MQLQYKHFLLMLGFILGTVTLVNAQVPVVLSPTARQQFFAANGTPLANGCLYTYLGGTSTPAATYTDSTGLFVAPNPIILDGGGFASIWIASQSYRFVLFSAGGTNCSTGSSQWTVDFINPGIFASGNNIFTGNNVFSGTSTFNGTVAMNAGGSMTGTFSGSPTFSGTPTFTGNVIFNTVTTNGVLTAAAGIITDAITGTLTAGGTMTVTGVNGSTANPGEAIQITSGTGGTGGGAGGAISVHGGPGGPTGGTGGTVSLTAGSAVSGSAPGGGANVTAGNGFGTGIGGQVTIAAGTGGTTTATGGPVVIQAGNGGNAGAGADVSIIPGAPGSGGTVSGSLLMGVGRTIYTSFDGGTCTATGLGGAGTCALDPEATDSDGIVLLTPDGGAGTNGTFTITFKKNMGMFSAACVYSLANGTGTWDPRATVIASTPSPTNVIAMWDNNGSVPTAAMNINVNYHCVGRN